MITRYEPPPRSDGYLDDGPERDDDMGPLPEGAWWFETYTASRDGIVPFEGDFDSDLDDDAWDEAFAAWCAAADLEGRTAFERCEPRAQLHELFDGVLEDLEAGLAREVAARAFDALIRYVDSILRPTDWVIFGWVHADRFAEALPRFLVLDAHERALAFSALAALFRARAIDRSLNEDRALRLAADFDRLSDAARAGVERSCATDA